MPQGNLIYEVGEDEGRLHIKDGYTTLSYCTQYPGARSWQVIPNVTKLFSLYITSNTIKFPTHTAWN